MYRSQVCLLTIVFMLFVFLFYLNCHIIFHIIILIYSDPVLVFPCKEGHVTCLDCFQTYCTSRLRDRQFWSHPELGYTLPCPAGCSDSLIEEVYHFHLLTDDQVTIYLQLH